MNTKLDRSAPAAAPRLLPALLARLSPLPLLAALVAAALGDAPAFAAEPELTNSITGAAGGTLLKGDRAQFQKLRNEKKDGWGGVERFQYSRDIDDTTSLTATGRALLGNNDFELDLRLVREDVGYLRAGLQHYRVWFDGSGGYFPPTDLFFHLYDEVMHIDRADFFVEAGSTRPDQIQFKFRYDFTFRRGLKDSTIWGDTNLTGGLGTRSIVPAFLRIREHRHIVTASASRDLQDSRWELDGRYERQSQENSRNLRRQPLSPTDRRVTQREDADVDLFMVHGSFEAELGPKLTLGTGAAHYNLDNTISGSRIYGDAYDPVFDPLMSRRQTRDEGFYDLSGTTHMKQTLANVNLMYTPNETWTIVPELRAQRNTWGGEADFIETNVGNPPALTTSQDEIRTESGKSFRELTEAFEVRYTGFKNLALNAGIEATQSYGRLAEDLIEIETGVDQPYRTTDFRRDQQKAQVSAHWYPRSGLSFSAQYYWKGRQNSFSNTRTSSAPTGADRYPAFITHQDYEINDFNVRMTWSPWGQLRSVTRYDYQDNTLRTQEIGLAFIESGHVRTHMISQAITWNPLTRWYVQAAGNLVYDQTTTPAHDLTGPVAGVILNGDNNYFNGDLTTGYAMDEKTDVAVTYSYYRANNFADNSRVTVPYGAEARTQFIGVSFTQRPSATLAYTLRYAYGKHDDMTSGNNNNFEAHTVYGSVQYRF